MLEILFLHRFLCSFPMKSVCLKIFSKWQYSRSWITIFPFRKFLKQVMSMESFSTRSPFTLPALKGPVGLTENKYGFFTIYIKLHGWQVVISPWTMKTLLFF